MRDFSGKWVFGFSFNLGVCNIDEAEAWGIFKGLSIAWEKGIKHVEVECDSLRVVNWSQNFD